MDYFDQIMSEGPHTRGKIVSMVLKRMTGEEEAAIFLMIEPAAFVAMERLLDRHNNKLAAP